MFVQTLIEFVYLFLLPKFIEECNGQPLDETADWTRCMGLCAHTCLSTMPYKNSPQVI